MDNDMFVAACNRYVGRLASHVQSGGDSSILVKLLAYLLYTAWQGTGWGRTPAAGARLGDWRSPACGGTAPENLCAYPRCSVGRRRGRRAIYLALALACEL